MKRRQINIALTGEQAARLDHEASKHGLTASRLAYGFLAASIAEACTEASNITEASETAAMAALDNGRRMIPRASLWQQRGGSK